MRAACLLPLSWLACAAPPPKRAAPVAAIVVPAPSGSFASTPRPAASLSVSFADQNCIARYTDHGDIVRYDDSCARRDSEALVHAKDCALLTRGKRKCRTRAPDGGKRCDDRSDCSTFACLTSDAVAIGTRTSGRCLSCLDGCDVGRNNHVEGGVAQGSPHF